MSLCWWRGAREVYLQIAESGGNDPLAANSEVRDELLLKLLVLEELFHLRLEQILALLLQDRVLEIDR